MNQIKIGEFLKELRKEKGLTQEQFNVSRRSVSRWETGLTHLDYLLRIQPKLSMAALKYAVHLDH